MRAGRPLVLALAAIACGACGRIGYEPRDGSVGPPRPLCPWDDGPPAFGPAVELATVHAAGAIDIDPYVDGEGVLWISSDRASGTHQDLYRARSLPDGGFDAPSLANDLDLGPTIDDTSPTLGADGSWALHAGTGARNREIFYATRDTTTGLFATPQAMVTGLGPPSADYEDPFVITDVVSRRIVLFFAPTRMGHTQDVFVASRALDPGASFGGASLVSVSSPTFDDSDPTVDASLTVLLFTSTRPGGSLWYATRATSDDPWGAPQAMPQLGPGRDVDAFLSPDACTLYFVSGPTGTGPDASLYVVRATPP